MTYLPTLPVFPAVCLEITFATVFLPSAKVQFQISFGPVLAKIAYIQAENFQNKGNWQFEGK